MKRISDIALIVYDFDGVMTDNKVMIDRYGNELVFVSRADGLAVSKLREMGIKQLIVSTEKNPIVLERARKLGIPCLGAVKDKRMTLKGYLARNKIDKKRVIFIGNDINDLDVMRYVGYSIAPSDAYEEVKKIASFVTKRAGGSGVVREVLSMITSAYCQKEI